MLKGFIPRLYQETILATAALKNTLVVLPTGMGKTGIALLLTVQRLQQRPGSKVVILAPTKPLAEQHLATFKQFLEVPESTFALFTGEIPPQERAFLWRTASIIFSTPQGMENDVLGEKIDLKNVSLFVFDEAHRAVGDYSYVFLAKQYLKKADFPRILALTASPGSELEKIEEVCKNLQIEAVEIRTEADPDVSEYIQDIESEIIKVELPEEFKKVKRLLEQCIKSKIDTLKNVGLKSRFVSKKDLLMLQGQLQAKMASGERDFEVLKALSIIAEVLKAQHALELLETQGASQANQYLDNLYKQAESSKVKAVKNLTADVTFKSARILTQKLSEQKIEHPKLISLQDFMKNEFEKNKMIKIILFAHYRDTASLLAEKVNKIEGAIARVFVGQAKKKDVGLSQKQQAEMLDQFRDGLFNILIATSVAEEGLDIPKVDLVIFYEPIPSVIRHIQRRGRTGRQEKGRVVIFMTKNTREEAYMWSAKYKEKRMISTLENLRKSLNLKLAPAQTTLKKVEAGVRIIADYRERSSGVVKVLSDFGVSLRLEMLQSADYLLSSRVGVELKLVDDFVDSIIDGRLLEQLKILKTTFPRPVVIVQGSKDIYSVRNVHPNAIRGMLATIMVSYGIPVIQTKDERDTAELLIAIAKREQDDSKSDFAPHADRKPASLQEQQEYLVSAFPNIGLNLAKELLKHFKSIKNIINASEEELTKVEGVGDKKAKGIKDISEGEYSKQ